MSLAFLLALCALLAPPGALRQVQAEEQEEEEVGEVHNEEEEHGEEEENAEDDQGEEHEEHHEAHNEEEDENEEEVEHGDGEEEMEVEDPPNEPLSNEQLRSLHKGFDKDGNGRASLAEVMVFANHMVKQASQKDVDMYLGEVDRNKDGKLSLDEYMKEIREGETEGETEDPELSKMHEERRTVEESKFVAADSDGDKVLDANEFPGLFFPETNEKVLNVEVQETMKERDTNKDGKLTLAEFFEVPVEEVDDHDKETFAKLDKDHDGKLDVSEMKSWETGQYQTQEALQELLKVADKDKDGHMTVEELIQAREAISDLEAHQHLAAWVNEL